MGGGANSRGGYILKILCVKMKESGPSGGVRQARPLDPPMYVSVIYLVQSAPLNSAKKEAKIFSQIQCGVKFGIAFNTGSQWSVSRGNGRNRQVG